MAAFLYHLAIPRLFIWLYCFKWQMPRRARSLGKPITTGDAGNVEIVYPFKNLPQIINYRKGIWPTRISSQSLTTGKEKCWWHILTAYTEQLGIINAPVRRAFRICAVQLFWEFDQSLWASHISTNISTFRSTMRWSNILSRIFNMWKDFGRVCDLRIPDIASRVCYEARGRSDNCQRRRLTLYYLFVIKLATGTIIDI